MAAVASVSHPTLLDVLGIMAAEGFTEAANACVNLCEASRSDTFLAAGVAPCFQGRWKRTRLLHAARTGNVARARWWLGCGASPNFPQYGFGAETPVWMAAEAALQYTPSGDLILDLALPADAATADAVTVGVASGGSTHAAATAARAGSRAGATSSGRHLAVVSLLCRHPAIDPLQALPQAARCGLLADCAHLGDRLLHMLQQDGGAQLAVQQAHSKACSEAGKWRRREVTQLLQRTHPLAAALGAAGGAPSTQEQGSSSGSGGSSGSSGGGGSGGGSVRAGGAVSLAAAVKAQQQLQQQQRRHSGQRQQHKQGKGNK